MAWLTDLFERAVRRVAAHRREALVVFGFVACLSVLVFVTGLAPQTARMLGANVGGGAPSAVLLAMTLAWLPLMVIDMKRCTRETALRKHVEADLEQRKRAERALVEVHEEARRRVTAVLDSGGPNVVVQPIVDMRTHDVVGFEALSRFADQGNPAEWFAAAAEVGLGAELELAAVRRALAELHRLPADAYLSVNVGAATLLDSRLHAILRGSQPHRLVVELTEHCAVADYQECRAALGELRSRGLRLAVDDAGAGYASLRHIVDLAPDIIKVDRALVHGIDRDAARRSLFLALVTFANDLDAHLIAEGVETASEAEQLARWGVRLGQGWHFGRPGPAGERPAPVLQHLAG